MKKTKTSNEQTNTKKSLFYFLGLEQWTVLENNKWQISGVFLKLITKSWKLAIWTHKIRYTRICAHISAYMHISTHICLYAHTSAYIHIYIYAYLCIYLDLIFWPGFQALRVLMSVKTFAPCIDCFMREYNLRQVFRRLLPRLLVLPLLPFVCRLSVPKLGHSICLNPLFYAWV
jgi:hypothetical protein